MSNTKIVQQQTIPNVATLWKNVTNNPSDFMSWTYLLHSVEQMDDIDSIREAYNQFLHNYPYCYVYWKKFADHELKYSDEGTAIQVLEKAVTAFPLSIDLWMHYINMFIKYNTNQTETIALFMSAINSCGQDFNSSDLWQIYINWLTDNKLLKQTLKAYEGLLQTATAKLSKHYESFVAFVNDNNPLDIVDKYEYDLYDTEFSNAHSPSLDDAPKVKHINGELINESNHCDSIINEKNEKKQKFIRKKIIEKRKNCYEDTLKEVEERLHFEDNIKRPYFHVNPLNTCQLDNWMKYIQWQIHSGPHSKVVFLFERCLVSCALYEVMWMKYVNYLIDMRKEDLNSERKHCLDIDVIRRVFERGCFVHLKKSLKLYYMWSLFEESEGNFQEAVTILEKFEAQNPLIIEATLYKINLFHRQRDFDQVDQLYKAAIANCLESDNIRVASHLSCKRARFLLKARKDPQQATQVLTDALSYDPCNHILYLQLIDFEYQQNTIDVNKIIELFDAAISAIDDYNIKYTFVQRKLEFLQDFGCTTIEIQAAINRMQNMMHGYDDSQKHKIDINDVMNSGASAVKKIKTDTDSEENKIEKVT